MPLYTFFPCPAGGTAATFDSFELVDDAAAYELATIILRQDETADYVAVWCGERKVCTTPRQGITAADLISDGKPTVQVSAPANSR